MILDLGDIAAHDRPDIGVGDDGRAAFELAVFLRKLVRRRDEHPGVALLQNGLGARFMVGAGVAVEKQNGGGLDPEPFQHVAELLHLVVIERNLDFAVGQHALSDFEPQRPLHQGLVLLKEEVIGIGPVDAADLVDIAKAARDDQRGLCAGALQDGVDGER